MNKSTSERFYPSSAEEGWPRHQEKSCPFLLEAAGVVLVNHNQNKELDQHHPVCAE
jgi:hypothetical protein